MAWNALNDTDLVSGRTTLGDLGSPTFSYWKLAVALIVLYFTWEQAYFLASR